MPKLMVLSATPIHPGLGPALEDLAQCASRFSINLDKRVELHNPFVGGTLHPERTRVAVKVVCGGPPFDRKTVKEIVREVHTWSKLHHSDVLPLLGITTKFQCTISIVSAWIDKGNAHSYIQDETIDPRPLIDGIARGLQYLHTYETGGSIFHGDLKGGNVLISPEGHPLLTDFGFSYGVDSSLKLSVSTPHGGSLNWMAVEKMDTGKVTAEGDVWAFGITALELFTRKIPFHGCWGNIAVMTRIVRGPLNRPSADDTLFRLADDHGERLMEKGMEDFLRMKREVFGNVPTIFVFTKYDKLLDYIEGTSDDVPINVEQQAEDYLKRQRNRVSAAFRPIKLPYDAGLVFVNWVYNTYQRLPVVQQIFMAYIVDLAHVLKTLFTFTAGTNEKRLTRRPIKASFNTYNSSQFRRYVHIEVKVISNAGNRDVVLEKIESLVRADNGLTPSLPRVTNVEFDEDEAWHTSFDGT
ncbi:kinase-like domain-containing protein [Scleroderma yunnanense]